MIEHVEGEWRSGGPGAEIDLRRRMAAISVRRNVGMMAIGSGASLAAFPLAARAWSAQSWWWIWAIGAGVAVAVGVLGVIDHPGGLGTGLTGGSGAEPVVRRRADRQGALILAAWSMALGLVGTTLWVVAAVRGSRSLLWWTATAFLVAVALALALAAVDEARQAGRPRRAEPGRSHG